MKVFKRIKWSYVVLSAMFLLLGIYLVVNPETSLVMICRILGAAMAVFGVMKIVLYFIREVEGVAIRFDFAVGLFCIILGTLMLWRAPALTDILSVMIGLLVLVDSVFKLQVAVDSRRMGAHSWWVTLVCTVVCLVLGILLVFNPFDGKQVLTIMMGVSLIVDGVQNLCTVVYAAIFVKDVKAAVHDFIMTLPQGYDTRVANDAESISQGQRQLLTIARVLLNNPAILILDEATSSVDTRTELAIGRAMDALMRGRTSFVIAHRLSTIVDADLILVMDHGNIIEQGTHKELLAAEGAYADLYLSQFA